MTETSLTDAPTPPDPAPATPDDPADVLDDAVGDVDVAAVALRRQRDEHAVGRWIATVERDQAVARIRLLEAERDPEVPRPPGREERRARKRRCIVHGGHYDGRAIWRERMERESWARSHWMPMESPRWEPAKRVSWDQWVRAVKVITEEVRRDPDGPVRIIALPAFPMATLTGWQDAAAGRFDGPWGQVWEAVKAIRPDTRHKVVFRWWEIDASHYVTRLTVGDELYGPLKADASRCRGARDAAKRWVEMGRRICGERTARFEWNVSGRISTPAKQEFFELACPGGDYVDVLGLDRYTQAEDAADPDKVTADLAQLLEWAHDLGVPPAISEGSPFMDKVNSKTKRQVGGLDTPGAVECLRRWDQVLEDEDVEYASLFERDPPSGEGRFTLYTVGADWTRPELTKETSRFPNGRTYPVHAPELVEESIRLGWVGAA